ncbi:hypothetical protein [Deinococcus ruber]|uniref:Uncharacterized protein n=1 Tax=Deinococcus ruber TaxID=1848197 RepID=A0A918FHH8_9DEIO|nr:hypothetical protein [Deinococcus ruber]GGR37931.1 hypothetical protein GCM10008957_54040 [Deinococcus ruber]
MPEHLPPAPVSTPRTVLEDLQKACIKLNGLPARAAGLVDDKFIRIVTQEPISGHSYLSEQWHFLSAERVLLAGGKFAT